MDFLLSAGDQQQAQDCPWTSAGGNNIPQEQFNAANKLDLLLLQAYSTAILANNGTLLPVPPNSLDSLNPLNSLNLLQLALGQQQQQASSTAVQWPRTATPTATATMASPVLPLLAHQNQQSEQQQLMNLSSALNLSRADLLLLLATGSPHSPSSSSSSSSSFGGLLPTCLPPDFSQRHFLMHSVGSNLAGVHPSSAHFTGTDLLPPLSCPSDTSDTSSTTTHEVAEATGSSNNKTATNTAAVGRVHRLSYPREFKLIVLHSFRANGQNKYRTCKDFQITKSMLNGWLQKADKIRNSRPGSLKSGRSGRRPQFPRIERSLFELCRVQAATGQPVTNKWIRETARQLAECQQQQSGPEEEITTKMDEEEDGNSNNNNHHSHEEAAPVQQQCQFSERWLNNFKRRFGIQTVAGHGHCNSSNVEETAATASVRHESTLEEAQESASSLSTNFAVAASSAFDLASQQHPVDEVNGNGKDEKIGEDEDEALQWARIGREICSTAGQLPIQAFYARFPKIIGQQSPNAEIGKSL